MKTLLTYGTFDLFHFGHVELLRRMADLCDRLVVACSTDEFNALKGKECIIPFEHRCIVLSACRYVDDVIPENNWEQKRADILNGKIDIFAMGSDWEGKFDDLADICEVVYLPRTDGISSSDIKADLLKAKKVG